MMTKRKLNRSSLTPLQLERKIALIRAGSSAAQLAEELGVSPQMVSLVIRDKATSRRIAEAIAEKAGAPLSNLFPDLAA